MTEKRQAGLKKFVGTAIALVALFFGGRVLLVSWMMSVPSEPFDESPIHEAPDYTNLDHWAALPDREDGADQVPPGSGYVDGQATAKADVFFVHPTSAFYGDTWNASMDNRFSRMALDKGIIPQHTTAFNGVAKIYAPRYRSVRMAVWFADDRESVEKAVDLAYGDVKDAFDYYMEHWNNGRPIILVSHSQGTMMLRRMLREEFDGKPISQQLVAAYVIGHSIPLDDYSDQLPICESAEQTHCYISWNTVLEGGSSYHWVGEGGFDKIACVNPLSWKADLEPVEASVNEGSLPMVGALGLKKLDKHLVGARCGEKGITWINKPEAPGYTHALFDDGLYHTYDINFYYDSIRENAQLRVDRFFEEEVSGE
jgi:hypothetical protein